MFNIVCFYPSKLSSSHFGNLLSQATHQYNQAYQGDMIIKGMIMDIMLTILCQLKA